MPSSPRPSPELPPSEWNPFVISLIGAVCTIFLLLSYYRILKRHYCVLRGAPFFRNLTERRLLNEANPDDPSLQFHSRGLESSILDSVPAIQFRKRIEGEIIQCNVECAVCLGEFEEGEWLRLLPNCAHSFHISCIDTWFQSHSNCPLCRSNVVYNLTGHHGNSISTFTLFETLRREDTHRERANGYQSAHFESFDNSTIGQGPTNANRFDPSLDNSASNMDSSSVVGNDRRNMRALQMGVLSTMSELQEPP